MAKIFEHFHLSLIERDQPDLLVSPMMREDWLRHQLAGQFQFRHMGNIFYWIPKFWSDEFITAVVERKRSKTQHIAPSEGRAAGDEFVGEEWQGSIVIIDPVHRPGGQKLAFEYDNSVGQPGAILTSLISHLNQDVTHQFAVHFKPLIQGGSFKRFAEKHGGMLQSITFRFTVPNMIFGAETSTEKGLKRIGKDTGAQEVDLKLESDDGVKANTETISEAVAYAEDGNAKITAKARNGEYWSSTSRKVTVKMERILNFAADTKGAVQLWLSEALDREADSGDTGADRTDSGIDGS